VLLAAKAYYTAVGQRISPNTIITRADFNSWWATAERDEKLETAFFDKYMEGWVAEYGGRRYGPVTLAQREAFYRRKYPSKTKYTDDWI